MSIANKYTGGVKMNAEVKEQVKKHLDKLIAKTDEVKSTQELVELSEQIYKISSVLLSKNYI